MGAVDGDSWRSMLGSGNFIGQTPGISGFSFGFDRLDAGAWYHPDPAGGGDLGLGKYRFTGNGTIFFPRLQHSGGRVFDLLGVFCSGAEAFGDGVYDFHPCRASDCGFGGCSNGGFLAGLERHGSIDAGGSGGDPGVDRIPETENP